MERLDLELVHLDPDVVREDADRSHVQPLHRISQTVSAYCLGWTRTRKRYS